MPSGFPPITSEVHLWLSHVDEADPIPTCGLDWLSDDEQRRLRRFLFARDRQRYLKTRLLTREVLSQYLGCPPGDLRFEVDANGRPQLAAEHAVQAQDVRFNISHCGGMIVLAVRKAADIGVDLEGLDRIVDVERMSRFFSRSEVEVLASLPAERQRAYFLDLWTLKESYVKARGLGLRLPLDQVAFDCRAPGTVTLSFDDAVGDSPRNWHLWHYHPYGTHVLAVCAAREGPRRPRLVAHSIQPLQHWHELALSPVRESIGP